MGKSESWLLTSKKEVGSEQKMQGRHLLSRIILWKVGSGQNSSKKNKSASRRSKLSPKNKTNPLLASSVFVARRVRSKAPASSPHVTARAGQRRTLPRRLLLWTAAVAPPASSCSRSHIASSIEAAERMAMAASGTGPRETRGWREVRWSGCEQPAERRVGSPAAWELGRRRSGAGQEAGRESGEGDAGRDEVEGWR